MEKLIVATANKKKFEEIKKILGNLPLEVKCLLDFKKRPKIIEDGKTFFENAQKKAEAASSFYNCWALGEDSGLEVLALGGKPGIFSSRFAGKDANDRKNIAKLLKELKKVPKCKRKARFSCWAVLAYKGRLVRKFSGSLSGFITFKPQGRFGFGYDPVFFLPKLKKTSAQISPSVKNKISHRYKAISKVKKYLENYFQNH